VKELICHNGAEISELIDDLMTWYQVFRVIVVNDRSSTKDIKHRRKCVS
jgi:hypothetical protein